MFELEKGFSYIFSEEFPAISYRVFKHHLRLGFSGLCVTGTRPEDLREEWKANVPVIWVTRDVYHESQVISPKRLQKLHLVISEFMGPRGKDSRIVLLDCLGYILKQESLDNIMKFLHATNESVIMGNGVLIISVNLKALGKKETGFLEKEFRVYQNEMLVAQLLDDGSAAED